MIGEFDQLHSTPVANAIVGHNLERSPGKAKSRGRVLRANIAPKYGRIVVHCRTWPQHVAGSGQRAVVVLQACGYEFKNLQGHRTNRSLQQDGHRGNRFQLKQA